MQFLSEPKLSHTGEGHNDNQSYSPFIGNSTQKNLAAHFESADQLSCDKDQQKNSVSEFSEKRDEISSSSDEKQLSASN